MTRLLEIIAVLAVVIYGYKTFYPQDFEMKFQSVRAQIADPLSRVTGTASAASSSGDDSTVPVPSTHKNYQLRDMYKRELNTLQWQQKQSPHSPDAAERSQRIRELKQQLAELQ